MLFEHTAIIPAVAAFHPEKRKLQALFVFPGPIVIAPGALIGITGGAHEFEEFAISYRIGADAESRNFLRGGFEFIVPAERRRRVGGVSGHSIGMALGAERGIASGNAD